MIMEESIGPGWSPRISVGASCRVNEIAMPCQMKVATAMSVAARRETGKETIKSATCSNVADTPRVTSAHFCAGRIIHALALTSVKMIAAAVAGRRATKPNVVEVDRKDNFS